MMPKALKFLSELRIPPLILSLVRREEVSSQDGIQISATAFSKWSWHGSGDDLEQVGSIHLTGTET